ncbi:VOC family protein [Streptomyces sp. H27-C3]|uniref:VOC family protein n=1 Tax=Streptomyces sp. H27-C3 TaxID=3046305 RepID=UPI0024BAFD62|nr:VOC family protein [Streptomyces sp. H27-C3]MDJ0465142.1 VOC family protein [Streptomyces sp. H27-C3]
MDWTLEVITVPVSDVDRAKAFYADQVGFKVDLDAEVAPGLRIVQLTPPGSRCSVALMSGMPTPPGSPGLGAPGSLRGVQLCVTDIEAARAKLVSRGVEVSPVLHVGPQGWAEGRSEADWSSFMHFTDPDGNAWNVQEAPAPLSER